MPRYYRYLQGLKLRKVVAPNRPRQPLWPPRLASGGRTSGRGQARGPEKSSVTGLALAFQPSDWVMGGAV